MPEDAQDCNDLDAIALITMKLPLDNYHRVWYIPRLQKSRYYCFDEVFQSTPITIIIAPQGAFFHSLPPKAAQLVTTTR